eukprot:SAG31_NODE_1213_length_9359_cov_4.298164_4_plen_56_part_00
MIRVVCDSCYAKLKDGSVQSIKLDDGSDRTLSKSVPLCCSSIPSHFLGLTLWLNF